MLNILNIQPISTSRGYIRFFVAVLSLYKKKNSGEIDYGNQSCIYCYVNCLMYSMPSLNVACSLATSGRRFLTYM